MHFLRGLRFFTRPLLPNISYIIHHWIEDDISDANDNDTDTHKDKDKDKDKDKRSEKTQQVLYFWKGYDSRIPNMMMVGELVMMHGG